MKKLIIMLALALVLALTAACFAEAASTETTVDTSGWQRYSFEGSGVSMLLPPDFGLEADEEMPEDSFYYAGNDSCALDVYEYDGFGTTNDDILSELGEQDYIEAAQIVTVGDQDIISFQGTDDDVFGYIVISPEGTIYEFNFYPFTETEDGIVVAGTIASSIEIG